MTYDLDRDYITINPAVLAAWWNVVIMRYDHATDELSVYKCSERLRREAAHALAQSWSKATGLKVLP